MCVGRYADYVGTGGGSAGEEGGKAEGVRTGGKGAGGAEVAEIDRRCVFEKHPRPVASCGDGDGCGSGLRGYNGHVGQDFAAGSHIGLQGFEAEQRQMVRGCRNRKRAGSRG